MAKVLLVEDDKSLREIYGVRLLAEGYDIVSAGDGEEALAMAIKEKPELIISDVMMPKISGFDMLDILRSTTETRDIKVIMMTALSSEDQRIRGEQLGADKYLVKSQVGIEDVVRTVHEVLDDNGKAGSPATAAAAAAATPAAATPAPADDNKTDAAATPAPAATTDEVKEEETPVNPVNAPEPAADPVAADTVAATSAAPGNDDAGPLPPQPSELASSAPVEPVVEPVVAPATEPASTLPEPTAPFTSPRPTNLGEQIVNPVGETPAADPLAVSPAVDAEPAVDPLAPAVDAAPVVSPVGEAPVVPEVPAAEPLAAAVPGVSSPEEPTVEVTVPPAVGGTPAV